MANVIRTRFQVVERKHVDGLQIISLAAMVNGKLANAGTRGGGGVSLATADPEMAAHFLPGTTFYVDFTEV